jgi:hypothetical protein
MKTLKKLFSHFLFILFLLTSLPAQALEADQYWMWQKQEGLNDSADQINELINAQFGEFMARFIQVKSTRKQPEKCEKIAKRFLKFVRPHFFLDRMKGAIMESETIDKFPEKSRMFKDYPKSIYKGFRWPFMMPVAQNVNIGGVYVGTDKIDHFFSSGRRYYKVYQKARKKGLTHQEALKKALDFGLSILEEKGILGYWSSGAFSYADIESNYKGMTLGLDMCQGEDPYLKHDEEHGWQVTRKIDMRDYVTPLWDEAFNNSYYFPYRWNGVKKVLLEKYCAVGKQPHVQRLWRRYHRKLKPAFHTDYLRGLIYIGKIPDPRLQSLHTTCEYPEGFMEGVPFWEMPVNEGEHEK